MIIIGLGTSKQVGKDTSARVICDERGNDYKIRCHAFADAVKAECTADMLEMFPLAHTFQNRELPLIGIWRAWCRNRGVPLGDTPLEVDFTDPKSPFGKCRKALQWWGTEYRRKQNEHYWTDRMQDKIAEALEDKVDVVLITDMRFPNEHDLIRLASRAWLDMFDKPTVQGYTWKLNRPGMADKDQHPSERALDGESFDFTTTACNLDDVRTCALWVFDRVVARPR